MRAATALLVAVADTYDDLARRSGALFAADRTEAERNLQAAMTRANQVRQQAQNTDAQANLPREWTAAETRHRNAENARRGTVAEMRTATNLYVAAADAFEDVIARNVQIAQQNEAAALAARAAAERERQAAVDIRADIVVRDDFNRADATFGQAGTAFNARNFAVALNQYNQSANQFIAATRETERLRLLADTTVEQARQRSAESTDFAITMGLAMEEDGDS